MSRTLEIINRLSGMEDIDIRAIRDEITHEYEHATEEDRVLLLETFNALMDFAERQLEPEQADKLRGLRVSDYRLMLMKECMDAEGNVTPERLVVVTRREIAAGRMSPDDDFHQLAEDGFKVLTPQPAPGPRSGKFARLFRWLSK